MYLVSTHRQTTLVDNLLTCFGQLLISSMDLQGILFLTFSRCRRLWREVR